MKKSILVLACLFSAVVCQGRIITVDDDGPADFNTIQAAIDDANYGDTVIVADGIERRKNVRKSAKWGMLVYQHLST